MRLTKEHLESWRPLCVLPLTPTYKPFVWSGATHETKLQPKETKTSLATNPDSMAIVFACGDTVVNASILPLLYTAPTASVRVWGAIAYNTRSPLVLIRGTT
ncbi:hypothetical protein TNCV_465161 [Trichonephila clavipes]|nr:hypothetical protein TNCV_465161 [Trichonephila clavipes]